MLKKMVRERLLALASTSEFLEIVAVGLIGTEIFYKFVRDEIANILSDSTDVIESVVRSAVAKELERLVIEVNENDILIMPSSGLAASEFDRLISIIPKDKRVGIIAADDVKILRIS